MPKYPYLTRAGKRGNWRYRRSVPAELRPLIGVREIVRSLGTPVLADALARYSSIAAEAERSLQAAQARLAARAGPARSGSHGSDKADRGKDLADCAQACAEHIERCRTRERAFREATTRRVLRDPAAFLRGEMRRGRRRRRAEDQLELLSGQDLGHRAE